jgi:hypothetical protein
VLRIFLKDSEAWDITVKPTDMSRQGSTVATNTLNTSAPKPGNLVFTYVSDLSQYQRVDNDSPTLNNLLLDDDIIHLLLVRQKVN